MSTKSTVSFDRITTSGTNIGSITIDGTTTQIYAPSGGGGPQIWIEDRISGVSGYSDLSVMKLSSDEYSQMVVLGETISNCLYVVQSDHIDAYGRQIKNLSAGTEASDAVNLEQLTSAYYQKSETSSAAQISSALTGGGGGGSGRYALETATLQSAGTSLSCAV